MGLLDCFDVDGKAWPLREQGASVGIRVGVCLSARHVVSIMHLADRMCWSMAVADDICPENVYIQKDWPIVAQACAPARIHADCLSLHVDEQLSGFVW